MTAMTVRNFINAYMGDFRAIVIREYTGDPRSCSADPEEDYTEAGTFINMKEIPERLLKGIVEYFVIDDGIIEIDLEGAA